ncbi:MAG: hypothetical protein QXN05_02540 [Acidilobaceae archaeon]
MDPKVLGSIFTVFGLIVAVVYSYLVLYTDYSQTLIKATLAATAIIIGGFIAGIGLALLFGSKRFSEAKSKIKKREEKDLE